MRLGLADGPADIHREHFAGAGRGDRQRAEECNYEQTTGTVWHFRNLLQTPV